MGDVLTMPPQESGRPRSVSITGWAFFGIACWMTFSVIMYLVVSGVVAPHIADSSIMGAKVWGVIAWVELVLGPAMILTSLRFLRLRRWARLPLLAFGSILVLGTLAFGVFWVVVLPGFFREMRDGPPLDPAGSVVITVFQVVMTVGGVAISLAFAAGFGVLTKRLQAPEVRDSVTVDGF